MAGKFRIFCDDGLQQNEQPEKRILGTTAGEAAIASVLASNKLAETKREPLGLKQTTTATSQVAIQAQPSANVVSSVSSSTDEEDQENDISMASLGSDFVPSILNDTATEQDEEEEEDEEVEDDHYISGIVNDYDNQSFEFDDDDDDDIENDEELQLELSKAFKSHDESQLFKSTIYIEDIKSYLKNLERQAELRPLPNYMDFQNDIDSKKRSILVNWLVEVAESFDLNTETLFISIGIIDRFLSNMSIPTCKFQLLGVAAMFIASKYEEIYPPDLYKFIEIADDAYSGQQIRQMEQEILKTLDFRITLPTTAYFLRQIFAYNKFSKKVYDLAEYLCHLSLIFDQPFLEYYPSEIALAAVMLAAQQFEATENISIDLRNAYDKSNIDQLHRRNLPKNCRLSDIDRRVYIVNKELPFCLEALIAIQRQAFSKSSRILADAAVIQKFSSASLNSVALLTPIKDEEMRSFHNG